MSDVRDQIQGPAREAFGRLNYSQQQDVMQYLQENHREYLYDKADVVNAWLAWNGIIGYSAVIISLVRNAYGDVAEKSVGG